MHFHTCNILHSRSFSCMYKYFHIYVQIFSYMWYSTYILGTRSRFRGGLVGLLLLLVWVWEEVGVVLLMVTRAALVSRLFSYMYKYFHICMCILIYVMDIPHLLSYMYTHFHICTYILIYVICYIADGSEADFSAFFFSSSGSGKKLASSCLVFEV